MESSILKIKRAYPEVRDVVASTSCTWCEASVPIDPEAKDAGSLGPGLRRGLVLGRTHDGRWLEYDSEATDGREYMRAILNEDAVPGTFASCLL